MSGGLTTYANSESIYVIKADGLAAGKGVLVTESLKEANDFLDMIFDGKVDSGNASNDTTPGLVNNLFLNLEDDLAKCFALIIWDT